jgi:Tfp pilus assembly protein PilO
MDKLKQYVVFTVIGCLLVLAAGWFLLVSPKRSDASALRKDAATVVAANSQLETQLQVLKAQAKALPKQQAALAAVAAKIPDNPALPSLIRALTTAAGASGVELVSVTPSTPVASLATAPVAGTAAAGSAGTLASIPLSLNVAGTYFNVEQFMDKLENLSRSLRVSTLGIAPGGNPVKIGKAGTVADDGKTLVATITAQVFMAANRPPTTAVTVPGQPVAGTAVGSVVPVVPVTPAKK